MMHHTQSRSRAHGVIDWTDARFFALALAGLSTWVIVTCIGRGGESIGESNDLVTAWQRAFLCCILRPSHQVYAFADLEHRLHVADHSLWPRRELQIALLCRPSRRWYECQILCTSSMLQIDANTLSYAGRALHMVPRHGTGTSGALCRGCGPRDARSVLRCYAPFRVSDGRRWELIFARAPTRRVCDW